MEAMRQRMEDLGRVVEDDQVPKPQRAQTFWHGWEHEGQVVQ
jgi:hypothetical protein